MPITESNYETVFDVYDTNQSYFLLTEGKPITLSGVLQSILSVPKGVSPNNKYCLGLQKKQSATADVIKSTTADANTITHETANSEPKMIAYLEFYTSLPSPECIWLSLLLVHVKHQGKSIGGEIVKALIKAARATRHKEIRLGIVANHLKGVSFWKKMGFVEIDRATTTQRDVTLEIIIFKLNLDF